MLKDKIAIITGGARGLGLAAARRFLADGACVALWDVQQAGLDAARATLVAELPDGQGARVMVAVVDVTSGEKVKAAFDEVEKVLGPVDVLVNNAGITRDSMLYKMDEAAFDAVIAVNLKGVFLCGREAAIRMRERGKGSIINTSSVVGLYGNIGQTNYAASKAGVIAMTKTWARELGPKGVRVNAVAPGFTMTEMMATVPEKVLDGMREKTPLRRLGKPEEQAAAFAWLASDESSFVTGAVLSVDGGLSL